MKRIFWIIFLGVCTICVTAQELREVHHVQNKIDSIQYEMQDYRDSMKLEMKAYRDSLREARRHAYDDIPHDLRIGVGDQLFETIMWRDRGHYQNMPEWYEAPYDENFRYTQHCFVEYVYNFNYWYGLGLLVDYSGVIWDRVVRNGQGKEISRERDRNFHNIAIIPTVRFSYFHHDYVSLYSALGVGLNVNTGTELIKGRATVVAPAANITLLGMRVGKGCFYGAVEIGAMAALNNAYEVYMFGSRLFTASIGVRF
jgi:hypothetical protein